MNELHKNEQEMRKKDAEDRAVEKKHQENVARDQQQLATLVGCVDEMERFVVMLDDSKIAAEQTAAVANLLLVDHPHSVKKNIEKDIALTEATGRQYDTMHFNMFCAAWSNTFERELYTKKGRLDTQQEIEEKRAEVKMAKKTKNQRRLAELVKHQELLVERRGEQDEEITELTRELELLKMCEGGDHNSSTRLCYCVAPVLERLGTLQEDRTHPHGIQPDRVHIEAIAPFVTHRCVPCKPGVESACWTSDGKLRHDLAGFKVPGNDLTSDYAEHKHGALVLPPADPTPELKRQVLDTATAEIMVLEEAEAEAIQAARERKEAAMRKMMPGYNRNQLADRGSPATEPEPQPADDGGVMRRGTSKTKQKRSGAIVAVLGGSDGAGGPPEGVPQGTLRSVNVKTKKGTIQLEVSASDTFANVKAKIQDKQGSAKGSLKCGGEKMDDKKTLGACGIKQGATLELK